MRPLVLRKSAVKAPVRNFEVYRKFRRITEIEGRNLYEIGNKMSA